MIVKEHAEILITTDKKFYQSLVQKGGFPQPKTPKELLLKYEQNF